MRFFIIFGAAFFFISCGDASFTGSSSNSKKTEKKQNSNSTDALSSAKEDSSDGTSPTGESDAGDSSSSAKIEDYDIAGVDGKDLKALNLCLSKFDDLPFGQSIPADQVEVFVAGGIGPFKKEIKDTEATEKPKLVLIKNTINIATSTNYQLLNPNAYYCISNSLNIVANVDIELSCAAQISDTEKNIEILASASDSPASKGLHILAQVNVTNVVNVSEDQCIRKD